MERVQTLDDGLRVVKGSQGIPSDGATHVLSLLQTSFLKKDAAYPLIRRFSDGSVQVRDNIGMRALLRIGEFQNIEILPGELEKRKQREIEAETKSVTEATPEEVREEAEGLLLNKWVAYHLFGRTAKRSSHYVDGGTVEIGENGEPAKELGCYSSEKEDAEEALAEIKRKPDRVRRRFEELLEELSGIGMRELFLEWTPEFVSKAAVLAMMEEKAAQSAQ